VADREQVPRGAEPQIPEGLRRWNLRIDSWFGSAATIVIDIMALFSLVALLFTTWGVGVALFAVIKQHAYTHINDVIIEILTVFIVVEVLSVSVRFLRANRIEVRDLVDVTLAILFREIWVTMFSGDLHWQEMLGLAALVVSLGALRLFMTRQAALGITRVEADTERE